MENLERMQMQILNTKFHIPFPDSHTTVPRKALLDQMSDVKTKSLVLVQASAGFGKTTFLAQWIAVEQKQSETAWVSLERGDNTWSAFWAYVLTAFEKIDSHVCGQVKQLLESGQVREQEDLLITLINALEASESKFCLVLDDFHLISDPSIHNGINFLIDHPIDNLLMVIVTRKSPPLGLARLRISGRLKEINERQLRFSRQETIDFIQGFCPYAMADEVIDRLVEHTEGWVAALKLIMLSLRESKDFSLDHMPGKNRFIQDYLMEEVFAHLPGQIQSLMPVLSILSRFTKDLVMALSNHDAGVDPIDFMKQHHLFLIPLDDSGQWFRFHHLFQGFLTAELAKKGPEVIAPLHLTSFKWFEQNGFFEEAFSHGLKAGRQDLAARVFAAHISSLYGRGGEQSLVPLFKHLSPKIIRTIPILACHYYATRIFNGNFDAIEQIKSLVEKAKTKEDQTLLTGFHMAFLGYASFYRTGDLEDAIEKCLLALGLIPETHGAMRQMMGFMLTLSYRLLGKIEPARILSAPRENDNLLMSALATMNRSLLEMELGNLSLAGKLVQNEILSIEQAFGSNIPSLYGFIFVIKGMILKEENQMSRAGHFFSKGISIIRTTGLLELIIISYGEYAVFLCEINEFNRAHVAVDHAISIARQSFSWIEHLLLAQKRYIWLREKKLDLVRPWAQDIVIEKDVGISYQKSQDYLVLARYCMEMGQWEKVFWILDTLIRADGKENRSRRLMESLVLKARAQVLSGRGEAAMDFLVQATELSRNQGYVQLFLNEMKGMEGLYQSLHAKGGLPLHLVNILKTPLCVKQVQIREFTEEFNARELAILKLFQQGVSNKEAASTLCLSVNTVRWYASRIFTKLSVKRRGQAVSEALRLELI